MERSLVRSTPHRAGKWSSWEAAPRRSAQRTPSRRVRQHLPAYRFGFLPCRPILNPKRNRHSHEHLSPRTLPRYFSATPQLRCQSSEHARATPRPPPRIPRSVSASALARGADNATPRSTPRSNPPASRPGPHSFTAFLPSWLIRGHCCLADASRTHHVDSPPRPMP